MDKNVDRPAPAAQVGENLRRLRENRGWTQKELAAKAGITKQTVGRYERGYYGMTMYNAVLLADALDVSLDVLAGRL